MKANPHYPFSLFYNPLLLHSPILFLTLLLQAGVESQHAEIRAKAARVAEGLDEVTTPLVFL